MVSNAAFEANSITLLGTFNPAIFQPAWFGAEGLLRSAEADNAKIELIRPELSKFTTDWLTLEVIDQRFFASTTNTSMSETLKDLVIGIFRLLRHTPITQLDISSEVHVRIDNEENWHSLGHRLAPKGLWEGILEKPGLQSLVMQGERSDGLAGVQFVKVEPSRRPEFHPAVFIQVIDRYMADPKKQPLGSEKIMTLLDENWRRTLDNGQRVMSELIKR